MPRRSMNVRALLWVGALLIATVLPLSVNAQSTKSSKPPTPAVAQASRPGIDSLCPLLTIGIGLFVASSGGFLASALLERASRSAMHIAQASRLILLAGLAVLLIYSLSIAYVVLFR